MKKLVRDLLLVFIMTILILLSYAFLEGRLKDFRPGSIIHFLVNKEEEEEKAEHVEKKAFDQQPYCGVWLSYLEFQAYRQSVGKNNEKNFRNFYQHVLDRCKELHMTHIIVQVRPFGDALYPSDYYPWSKCISGKQGKSPGYDPLKIMVELTHKSDMKIEAWVNPYRISPDDEIDNLSVLNPARIWSQDETTARNVLEYDGALYYNPSSKQVRKLITDGISEIVRNYDVDGIHMDDYFYPAFDADNVDTAFDAPEFHAGKKEGNIASDMRVEEWRRYNVNLLIHGIYKAVKKADSTVTFGISPSGNPANLRSDFACYADIDTWIEKDDYIDYIMPQIYWGYSQEEAPFDKMLKQWTDLCDDSSVNLVIGLQLYRMGTTDKNQSDYKELQSADLIERQIHQVSEDSHVQGYCLFSFQYLDADNTSYQFDTEEFSEQRKKILMDIAGRIEKDQ